MINLGIIFRLKQEEPFTYTYFSNLPMGTVVKADLRGKLQIGVVCGKSEKEFALLTLKPLTSVSDFVLPDVSLQLIEIGNKYFHIPIGLLLKMILPSKIPGRKIKDFVFSGRIKPWVLTDKQRKVLVKIKDDWSKPIVLQGITGSGKTAIYFALIEEALIQGKQVLVLLPEINLVYDWWEKFVEQFSFEPNAWHSKLTPKQREENWLKAFLQDQGITIGTRSALFLPYKNLGLIIIDEEHDNSFRQEEGEVYHARELAIMLAQRKSIPLVLGSATPSLETLAAVAEGAYNILKLDERFSKVSLPELFFIRYRLNDHKPFAPLVKENITAAFNNGEQVLIFLNRRGYAPILLCQDCKKALECQTCSVFLSFNKEYGKLICYHCLKQETFKKCADCGANKFISYGMGVEKLLNYIHREWPTAKVRLFSSDHIRTPKAIKQFLADVKQKKIDFIVGTQMIAKGYNFPALTTVVILDADAMLKGGNFRAAENTWQLLTQVSGRAGRDQIQGKVFIQTLNPENQLFQSMFAKFGESFVANELAKRKKENLPPFSRLVSLIVKSYDEEKVRKIAWDIKKVLGEKILGPVPAPIYKINNVFRFRLLGFIDILDLLKPFKNVKELKIELDPYNFN